MKLSDLLLNEREYKATGPTNRIVAALRYDSRRVAKDDVFFSWKGEKEDGHRYIAEVCDRGAAAVVLEDKTFLGKEGPTYIEVPDARKSLARMAAIYFGRPDLALKMIGITGTNGKTTTTFLVKHLLESTGEKVGLIGTVQYEIDKRLLPANRTTPEALDLHELLGQMRDAGCKSVVMEVSSHALEQGRVLPIEFQVGVFTNLTQDHLDYHGTMEEYFAAKKLLFQNLDREKNPGSAVINLDDPWAEKMREGLSAQVKQILYSVKNHSAANLSASELKFTTEGTTGFLHFGQETFPFSLPLLGSFNVENALAAAGVAWALGLKPKKIAEELKKSPQIPGRLQRFISKDHITAVVDYAHTDDAVKKALTVLRDLTKGRLIVVIGCGGNRDQSKRPKMAQAAVQLADYAIFTADNPRSESIETILDQMEAGVRSAKNFSRQPDRRAAIAEALAMAKSGDIVCVAGKGHEATQEIDGKYLPFDDRQVVEEFLKRRSS